jgi:hypothetical protein
LPMSALGHSRPSADVRLQTTPDQKKGPLTSALAAMRTDAAARSRSRRSLPSPPPHRSRDQFGGPGLCRGRGRAPRDHARPRRRRGTSQAVGGPSVRCRGRERTEECSRQRFSRRARVHRGPTMFECRHRKACWTARRLRAKARRAKPDRFGSTPSAARSHRAACPCPGSSARFGSEDTDGFNDPSRQTSDSEASMLVRTIRVVVGQ